MQYRLASYLARIKSRLDPTKIRCQRQADSKTIQNNQGQLRQTAVLIACHDLDPEVGHVNHRFIRPTTKFQALRIVCVIKEEKLQPHTRPYLGTTWINSIDYEGPDTPCTNVR